MSFLDKSGIYLSNGIEMGWRVLCFIGTVLVFVVGGATIALFWVAASPIMLVGFICTRLGFKPEWR